MNTYNKSKLFNIIVVVLLLLNTATVSFLLLKKDRHHLPPPPQQGGAFNFLVKELKLDSAQVQQYQALRDKHRNSTDSIRREIRSTKDSLFNLIKQNNSTDIVVQQKLNMIAQCERTLDEITFNHFKLIRGICNSQQQIKFDEVIATALKMNAPHQDSPHHPHNGKPPSGEEPDGRPEDDNRPPPPREE